MNSLVEISDTQAAAGLMGMVAGVCSDIFVGYDSKSYAHYVKNSIKSSTCGDDPKATEDGSGVDNDGIESNYSAEDDDDSSGDEDERVGSKRSDDQTKMHPSVDNFDADCPFEETAILPRSHYGVCPLYKVKNGKDLLPVPYPVLYRFRGKAFRHYCRWEFVTGVKVVMKTQLADGTSGVGRRKSSHFRFGKGCPLEESHVLQLRLKLCTLNMYSNPPPYPGEEPEHSEDDSLYKRKTKAWRAKADRFASFFLTLFRAEDKLYDSSHTKVYRYDWDAFIEFATGLKAPPSRQACGHPAGKLETPEIPRYIYNTMLSYILGWRTLPTTRKILSAYRGRNRDNWNEDEKREARNEFGRLYNQFAATSPHEGDNETDLSMLALPSYQQMSVTKEASYTQNLVDSLLSSKQDISQQGKLHHQGARVSLTRPAVPSYAEEIQEAAIVTLDGNTERTDDTCKGKLPPSDGFTITGGLQMSERISEYLESKALSPDKKVAVDILRDHFTAIRNGTPQDYQSPVVFVSGNPGVGKSYLVEVFDGMSEIMGAGEQIRLALFGIAAVNIDGESLCSMLNIKNRKNDSDGGEILGNFKDEEVVEWDEGRLLKFKQRYKLDKISCIIVDEVSTLKPSMIAIINHRLQQATQDFRPFGGKAGKS